MPTATERQTLTAGICSKVRVYLQDAQLRSGRQVSDPLQLGFSVFFQGEEQKCWNLSSSSSISFLKTFKFFIGGITY